MIGVFDSGHGGLTVLRALVDRFPNQSFLYFGDHGHVPYGDRSSEEIVDLTRAGVESLFARGCRLVILACNTAAAVALRSLQRDWLPIHYPDRRILGVLVPTVEALTGVRWQGRASRKQAGGAEQMVAVFATRRTVASHAYVDEIAKCASHITVVQQACSGLVDLIEQDAPRAKLRDVVQRNVAELLESVGARKLDAVLLGCTHYPLVSDLFSEVLPPGVPIWGQPTLVATSLADYLKRHPEFAETREPSLRFLTTGDPGVATRLASTFFGGPAQFERA